ncbi:MAG: hypothetical protein JO076_16030 [Verrucomicrobia bacterium]|nr:hypothetical protein [Verrucomicrobiota bacterium]
MDSRGFSSVGRRSFLRKMGAAGASLAPVAALLLKQDQALAREFSRGLTRGDVDILRFLAAAEILETDLWQQYNEFGGVQDNEVPGGSGNPAYTAALSNLDSDMAEYIHDNNDDENSHQMFLNAFLQSVGAEPVNLDRFRTLPSSKATGAQQIGRLTNLTQLTLDTSWYVRYRSTENPDLGVQFSPPFPIVNRPAIPLDDNDTPPNTDLTPPITTRNAIRMQAIADTAAFHFATIEQGGSSLYGSCIPKATSLVVLRILYAIGGSEVAHFQTWHDKAGNAVSTPLAPLTDPTAPEVTFPDLNSSAFGGEAFSTNLIMPEPCEFISHNLPACSIIRPTLSKNAGPIAVVTFLANMGLFKGQTPEFFQTLQRIATAANEARRRLASDDDDRLEGF